MLASAPQSVGGFFLAWHALRPLGQMSQTSGISCQRPSPFLPSYINNTYCAIYLFELIAFRCTPTPPAKSHTKHQTYSGGLYWLLAQSERGPSPTKRHARICAPKAHRVINMKTAKKLTPDRVGISFCNGLSGPPTGGRLPLRITQSAGVSGSMSQILRAQICAAILGNQSLGCEAVYDFGMVAFFKG